MGHSHHHHHHGHGHHHHHHGHEAHAHDAMEHHMEMSSRHFRLLKWVLWLTCAYLLVEIIGGLMSGSLALLADGFHMFADATAIGISLFAAWFAHRPAPIQKTFGYQRVEIMAAFFNALLLVGMGIFILVESYERFHSPVPIKANMMMLIAAGGLLVNLISVRILHADHQENLNLKGAYLHVMGDLLGSIGAMAAGFCISAFGWRWADPLISCLIALLIMASAIGLLKEAVNVLLESCPPHLDIEDIRKEILNCVGVQDVHHLHVWNINMQRTVLTAHLEVLPEAFTGETLNHVQTSLKHKFGLSHVTLQMELS